jgi:U3 small nucleolar RNA-associated protein 11
MLTSPVKPWRESVLVVFSHIFSLFISVMSSFRKRFARANKERSQPAHRAKFGLLEKHKDYVKRARDYNAKKEKLRVLEEKAALRNPDEFYHHMQNSVTKDGKHVELDAKTLTPEQLRLLNTHDQAYLISQTQKEGKAIERMVTELQFVGVKKPTHTVFVDSEEDIEGT